MPLIPPQPHSIAQATADALSKLSALSDDAHSHAESEYLTVARRYSDEIDRLKIWAYEHDVESGGLDYKLRDSSTLRKRVLSLVAQLSGTTDTTRSDGDDDETGRSAGLETLVADTPVHLLLSREDDDTTSLSLDTDCTLPDSLSDSPLTHIHDVVNLLFGLGPTLLNPVPRDRVEWSAHQDAAHYDVGHVQARFPQADRSLLERLGRANWERRQYLIRLRSKLDEDKHDTPGLDNISLVGTRLEKLTLESVASDPGDDTSGDDASDVGEARTGLSQTYDSHTETDASVRSPLTGTVSNSQSEFQFSANDVQSTALTEPSKGIQHIGPTILRYGVPAPPRPNQHFTGDEFLCPFCAHKVSDMKSAADWKSVNLSQIPVFGWTSTSLFVLTPV